jgi:hypothetical protein
VSWPSWLRKRVREFVVAATTGPWPQMKDQAKRLLEEIPDELAAPGPRRAGAERPRMGVDKSGLPFAPPSFPDRADRKTARNGRMHILRIAVLRRARGRCEFRCRVAGEPSDAHHIFGGSDRRELESEYTLAGICEDCHDKCNASPAWAREQALVFARRMAAAAQLAGDAAGVAGFTATVEQLEARIGLAEVQARPVTTNPKPEE